MDGGLCGASYAAEAPTKTLQLHEGTGSSFRDAAKPVRRHLPPLRLCSCEQEQVACLRGDLVPQRPPHSHRYTCRRDDHLEWFGLSFRECHAGTQRRDQGDVLDSRRGRHGKRRPAGHDQALGSIHLQLPDLPGPQGLSVRHSSSTDWGKILLMCRRLTCKGLGLEDRRRGAGIHRSWLGCKVLRVASDQGFGGHWLEGFPDQTLGSPSIRSDYHYLLP
mmetsp:Transcript_56652/g.132998  ORF Transcript_56652/g.132998 Transcript_56652/m.132998 type:complete len:219 (-) Transcript_56652:880-1536(-)